ncbi:hypothetical protein ACHAXT_011065 [Thalassiosira profunda]
MSHVGSVLANTALSLTLSGNSGISPFLTMFLIGIAAKVQPEYLPLDETMDKLMTSWPSLSFWSIMTILESIGKCVPVIDEIVDSVEVFVVPFLSTLGSFSAFGSFDSGDGSEQGGNSNRNLRGLSTVSTSSIATGAMKFLQVILVFFGIVLALSIHFCKMLLRLMGEGCLTQIITIVEATTVCTSVLISIFVRQFAIFAAACLVLAAAYGAKRKYDKWQEKKEGEAGGTEIGENNQTEYAEMDDGGEKTQSKWKSLTRIFADPGWG